MPLAAFDALGRVVADLPAMRVGLDALAVQDRGGGLAALAFLRAHFGSEQIVEDFPNAIPGPFPKHVVDRFPRRKVDGQEPPGNAALEDIENSVYNPPQVRGRPSALAALG